MESKILIVEDTAALAESIADILKMEGYRVAIARNGLEAMKMLEPDPPQLIITDIVMPEMDGFQLMKNIRSNASLNHIPIVMLSAAKMEDYDGGMALRPDIYLKKPCDLDVLVDTIGDLLEKYEKN